MASWNSGPHSHYQPLIHLRIQQQQGQPQPVVFDEIDVFIPNDHVEIIGPPGLYQELQADDLFYPPDTDFEAHAPSPVMEPNALDLNDLVQHLETDIDPQSLEISNGHSPLAVTLAPSSYYPWLPSAVATGDILLSDYPFQPSTQTFLSGSLGHPYSLATADHSLAHGTNSTFAGPSITSTSIPETGYPSLQEYTTAMALKVEGGFRCPMTGCEVLLKRRDALKNHFQQAHSESRETVVVP